MDKFEVYEAVHEAFNTNGSTSSTGVGFDGNGHLRITMALNLLDTMVIEQVLIHLRQLLWRLKKIKSHRQSSLDDNPFTIFIASSITINDLSLDEVLRDLFMMTLPWYCYLWLLECVRVAAKLNLLTDAHGLVSMGIDKSLNRVHGFQETDDIIHKLKLTASILRLATQSNYQLAPPMIIINIGELLASPETTFLIHHLHSSSSSSPSPSNDNMSAHVKSRRCTLGLVALDACPFAMHFLMRLWIYGLALGDAMVLSLLQSHCDGDYSYDDSYDGDDEQKSHYCSSDASLFIHGLFSHHEGLLYKFLTLTLTITDECWLDVNRLYEDVLWKYDYDVEVIVKALEGEVHGGRMLIYFKRLYQLMHNNGQSQMPCQQWHRDQLLPALRQKPHLRVIVKYLELALDN